MTQIQKRFIVTGITFLLIFSGIFLQLQGYFDTPRPLHAFIVLVLSIPFLWFAKDAFFPTFPPVNGQHRDLSDEAAHDLTTTGKKNPEEPS